MLVGLGTTKWKQRENVARSKGIKFQRFDLLADKITSKDLKFAITLSKLILKNRPEIIYGISIRMMPVVLLAASATQNENWLSQSLGLGLHSQTKLSAWPLGVNIFSSSVI